MGRLDVGLRGSVDLNDEECQEIYRRAWQRWTGCREAGMDENEAMTFVVSVLLKVDLGLTGYRLHPPCQPISLAGNGCMLDLGHEGPCAS